MRVNRFALPAALALLVCARVASAQGAPDSARAAAAEALTRRHDWLSDRVTLRVGDLLTVVVDEKAAANERVSHVASGNRSMRAGLRADLDTDSQNYAIQSGLSNDTRDVGEAGRSGGLTAVISVRVVSLEPGGIARVQGGRKVTVDGRQQDVTLQGVIRAEDVHASNLVYSNRVADAVILYRGKKISPRSGLVGKLLGAVWP